MIRRPPRSTQSRSSAASDVYKRQAFPFHTATGPSIGKYPSSPRATAGPPPASTPPAIVVGAWPGHIHRFPPATGPKPVSYTHLRAHETRHDLVCRLLLEKKKTKDSSALP